MKAIDYEEENTKRVTALELTGGPAHGGLTVLDYFAGKALEAQLSVPEVHVSIGKGSLTTSTIARACYEWAEAMLAERTKRYTSQGTIKGVTGKTYGHN